MAVLLRRLKGVSQTACFGTPLRAAPGDMVGNIGLIIYMRWCVVSHVAVVLDLSVPHFAFSFIFPADHFNANLNSMFRNWSRQLLNTNIREPTLTILCNANDERSLLHNDFIVV